MQSSYARRSALLAALLVGAVSLFVPMAHAQSSLSKFSPDLLNQLKVDPDSGLAPKTSANALKPATTKYVPVQYRVLVRVAGSVSKLPSVTSQYYSHTHIHAMKVGAHQLMALLSNSSVKSLSLERPMASNDVSVSSIPLDVNPVSVGADMAGAGLPSSGLSFAPTLDGSGVTVAVVDSGIAPVNDVKSHLIAFHDCVNGLTSPYDDYGHGTHVAGIIAGDGTDSSGPNATKQYRGIAPNVSLVGVKVLDGTGNATSTNVIAGIEWCIANKQTYNIRVINMSITGPVLESYKTDPVCQAVEAAVQSGIVVVMSAGNHGGTYGMIGSPANDPYVITVGASNSMQTADRSDDKITTYTSRGPTAIDENVKPDLIAPGNKVVSLRVPGSYIDLNNAYCYVDPSEYLSGDTIGIETAYTRLSGTSMSAPAVAGAAALILQKNSSLYPGGVKLALMYSAQALTGVDPMIGGVTVTYDPFTQGAGELNVPGAVQLASLMTPGGLTGTPTMTTTIASSPVTWFGASAPILLSSVDGKPGTAWWASTEIWSDPGLWSANNLTWSGGGGVAGGWTGGGDNLTWSGGGGLISSWTGGGDNLTWSGGGDNLTWSGGGGLMGSWTGGGDNLTWSGGGDNLTWSRGGD